MTRWMSRPAFAVVAVATLVAVTFGTRQTADAGGKSDEEVKLSVSAGKLDAGGKQTLTLTAVINKGWHIYANPVGNDDLAANATVIRIVGKAKPQEVNVNYPAGKEVNDKIIGKYRVYEEKVQTPIAVQRAAGDTGPLEVSVRI